MNEARGASAWSPYGLAAIGFALAIPITYRPSLVKHYLIGDEIDLLAPYANAQFGWRQLWSAMEQGLIQSGRPIHFAFNELGQYFSSIDLSALCVLRWGSAATSVALAVVFLRILYESGAAMWHAALLVALCWTHPAMQVFQAYWPLIIQMLAMILALWCTWTFLRRERASLGRGIGLFWAFFVGHLIHQAAPFVAMSLCAHCVLVRPSALRMRQAVWVVVLLLASLALNVMIHNLFSGPEQQYSRARQAYALGTGEGELGGSLAFGNVAAVFEFWNYPTPVVPRDAPWRTAAQILALVIPGALVAVRAALEIAAREARAKTKWAVVMMALGCSFVPMVAEHFSGRQHVMMASLMTVSVIVAHQVNRFVSSLRSKRLQYAMGTLAVLCLGLNAYGASAQFDRELVGPRHRLDLFAMKELAATNPDAPREVTILIPEPERCRLPCLGFHRRRVPVPERLKDGRYLRYLFWRLGYAGIPPDVRILRDHHVDGPSSPGAHVLDLRDFRKYPEP